jgi:electron transfer flavoprotein beta subunit
VPRWSAADVGADERKLGLQGSPTQVKNIFAPQIRTDREMIEGAADEQAAKLLAKLMELKCLS